MSATVAVLGPGAVGGALAVPLVLAGHRTICVARAATAAAIARDGLTLVRPGEDLHARPEAVEELGEPVDVLLVAVKATGLEDALGRIGEVPTVAASLLNGLEHVDVVRRRLGHRVGAGSVKRLEAYRESPTRIVQATEAVAVAVGSQDAVAEPIADVLRAAGATVELGPSEQAVLWAKAARQAAVAAATSLTQRPIGELRADRDWRPRLEEAIAEACAIASADGVELHPEAQWAIIDAMPPTLTTSTARDVAAGRPSELDAITGSVVRAASRLGVPCPELERLLVETERRCRPRSR